MSLKNFFEETSKNKVIFLGKKQEPPKILDNTLEKFDLNNSHCKLCSNNINLIKCIKCLNHFCQECLNNKLNINYNEIKTENFICKECNINNENKNNIKKCSLCEKEFPEINLIVYNITKEQEINIKNKINEINNINNISLIEEKEENNDQKNLNMKVVIKICNECNIIYKNIIDKYLVLKEKEKEEVEEDDIQKKKLDELSNLIMKDNENGEINIFDILENKSEIKEEIKNMPKEKINNENKIKLVNYKLLEKSEKKPNNSTNNLNQINRNSPSININSNNKTSNIYIPNFFTITSPLQNNQSQNQNKQNIIQEKTVHLPNNVHNTNNIPNIKTPQINQNINSNTNSNKINELINTYIKFLFQQNSNNLLNVDIGINNLSNCANGLKDIHEGINKLSNLNKIISENKNNNTKEEHHNKKENNFKELSQDIRNILNKLSRDLYNFDNNNIEYNLNVLNKIEFLAKIFYSLALNYSQNLNNNNNIEEDKNYLKNQNLNLNNNINNKLLNTNNDNYLEIINYILSINSSLVNQLRILKSYIDLEKIFVALIFQNITTYLKESEKDNNVKESILIPTISNIDTKSKNINYAQNQNNQFNLNNLNNATLNKIPLNTLNSFQGINLLNNLNSINQSSNLDLNNSFGKILPTLNYPIGIPNIFSPNLSLYNPPDGINLLGNNILPYLMNQMNNGNDINFGRNFQYINNNKNNS